MVSPGFASYEHNFSCCLSERDRGSLTTKFGANTRPAEPPTVTLIWAAVAWTAAVARKAESFKRLEKSMSSRLGRREGGKEGKGREVEGEE